MENSDLSFTPRFYLNVAAKYVRFTDNTDYSGEGINVSYVYGNIKLTAANSVVMYNNTSYGASSDIVGSSGTMYKDFVLPLDGVYVVAGTYTFEYTVQVIDGVNAIQTYTKSVSYTYSFTEPTLAVTFTIDGYNSTFSCIESTTYASSAYATTISRVLTITPPTGSGMAEGSNTVTSMGSNPTVSYAANIYSGEYEAELTSTILYTMADGLQIYSVETLTDTDTAYNIDMDALRDLLYAYTTTYYTQKGVSGYNVLELEENIMKLSTSLIHYILSLDYQELADAYDSALRVYAILEGDDPEVEEIVPFENQFSFTNTDEKVKMTSAGTASYLADLVDGTTIENNSGVLSVVGSLSDYVSAALGGTFSAIVNYGSDLSGTYTDRSLVDKAYVVSYVATALTDYIKLISLESTALGLTYNDGTGEFSLTSGYVIPTTTEETNWNTAYTFINNLTASYAELNYCDGVTSLIQDQLDGKQDSLTFGIANTNALLVNDASGGTSGEIARFTATGIESIANIVLTAQIEADIVHGNLDNLQGGTTSEYYHLTAAQHTIVTQEASATQSGYLTSTDFQTFDAKLDALTEGNGIDITTSVVSVVEAEIDHDSLDNYSVAQHRIINDSGTSATELWSASKISSSIGANSTVYVVSATAGSGSVVTRSFTQEYGWTVDDSATINYGFGLGSNATDLTIQHDLGKHCASVVVKAYGNFGNGNVYQALKGTQAYSTWYDSSDLNAIELTALCTDVYALEIVMTFSGLYTEVTTTTTTTTTTSTTTTTTTSA